tara:strand:+ start:1478 stop:1672 length:195 start_codon:yes stop_codon:yes gene_type:complete
MFLFLDLLKLRRTLQKFVINPQLKSFELRSYNYHKLLEGFPKLSQVLRAINKKTPEFDFRSFEF